MSGGCFVEASLFPVALTCMALGGIVVGYLIGRLRALSSQGEG